MDSSNASIQLRTSTERDRLLSLNRINRFGSLGKTIHTACMGNDVQRRAHEQRDGEVVLVDSRLPERKNG